MSEDAIHRAILDRLRAVLPTVARNTLVHVPNGGNRDVVTGAKLKALGARAGVADLLFLWDHGRAHWLEVKVEGVPELGVKRTYQSEAQKVFQRDVEAAGGRYAVARSSDEAVAICRSWGIPVKEKAIG